MTQQWINTHNAPFRGSIETPETEAKSFTEVQQEVEAFCARMFDGPSKAYKPAHGGYPAPAPCEAWKPGRDIPQGWDHV